MPQTSFSPFLIQVSITWSCTVLFHKPTTSLIVRKELGLSVEMLTDFKIKQLLNFFLFFHSTSSPRFYPVHGLKLHISYGMIHFLTDIPRALLAKHPSTSHWIKSLFSQQICENRINNFHSDHLLFPDTSTSLPFSPLEFSSSASSYYLSWLRTWETALEAKKNNYEMKTSENLAAKS